jgi:hypothetical protein
VWRRRLPLTPLRLPSLSLSVPLQGSVEEKAAPDSSETPLSLSVPLQGSVEEKALVPVVVRTPADGAAGAAAQPGVDFLLVHSHVTFLPGKRR